MCDSKKDFLSCANVFAREDRSASVVRTPSQCLSSFFYRPPSPRDESLVNVKEGARNEWSTKKILAAPSGSFFSRLSIDPEGESRLIRDLEGKGGWGTLLLKHLDHPRGFSSFPHPRTTSRIHRSNKCWKQLWWLGCQAFRQKRGKFCSLAS